VARAFYDETRPSNLPVGETIGALDLEQFSPIGPNGVVLIDVSQDPAGRRAAALAQGDAVIIGLHRVGACPDVDAAYYDMLLTTAPTPQKPWVSVAKEALEQRIDALLTRINRSPVAAATLCWLLRVTEGMEWRTALRLESLAYSTLLGGQEFARWRAATPAPDRSPPPSDRIRIERAADVVTVTLDQAGRRNAMDAGMRDALFEALAAVVDDPSRPELLLRGAGRCFSVGGDLAEFGTNSDLAMAHYVRSLRSCAMLLMALGERATVHLHGACIGSGIEIAAAAARRVAHPDAFFQLPEVAMGLIPGAGGTVTISRAIGRHRTAYMALSGRRFSARTGIEWGLATERAEC
jgi:enoyl-CoA hydratase/carnithine racemase